MDLRGALRGRIHHVVGSGTGAIDLARPPGDPGLFGPGSPAWAVHGDFTAMMVGGMSALFLQMLHPAALAGVWDHSGFRTDMAGRLRRTAQFIAGTTYGGTAEAERLIARVRAIHTRIRGTTADGIAYAADDPALLTWVHVAEVRSFLAAHLRYRDPAFPAARQDAYYAQVAEIARRLGATDVPDSRRAVEAYLHAMRPALRFDDRTRAVAEALLAERGEQPVLEPAARLMKRAALDLLPPFALALQGRRFVPFERQAIRAGVAGAGRVIRWALTDGAHARARRCTGDTAAAAG
ncbi:MAG: oxygenase MpaB family protein [Sphingomonas fennica]